MLAHEVFVLNVLRRGLGIRRDLQRVKRHFRNLLQYHRMINRLGGILSPGERPVIAADDAGHVFRIQPARFKRLANDPAGVALVGFFYLFGRERARAGNRALKIIGVRGSVAGNIAPGLRPGHRVRAVRVHNAADRRIGAVQFDVRVRV